MIIPEIDDKISEQYGIMPHGLVGMEIIRGSRSFGVFNQYQPGNRMPDGTVIDEQDCRRLNWRQAVSFYIREL